jgi:hypothetical protein
MQIPALCLSDQMRTHKPGNSLPVIKFFCHQIPLFIANNVAKVIGDPMIQPWSKNFISTVKESTRVAPCYHYSTVQYMSEYILRAILLVNFNIFRDRSRLNINKMNISYAKCLSPKQNITYVTSHMEVLPNRAGITTLSHCVRVWQSAVRYQYLLLIYHCESRYSTGWTTLVPPVFTSSGEIFGSVK